MKIHYITGGRIPSRAANSIQTVKMCAGFAENGHAVELFARAGVESSIGSEDIYGRYGLERSFHFHPIAEKGPRGFHTALFLRDVRRGVRRLEVPDLFFARDIYSLALLTSFGVPCVYEAHRTIEAGSLEARVFTYVSRQPDFCKLVTVTQPMMDRYVAQFPWLRSNQTLVLPNATDDMAARSWERRAGDIWPGRSGALQVGYVGHLYAGRGAETLIEAARLLPALDFHFVGGAPEDIERCKAAGVPGNVFFHGYVPYRQVPPYYHRFDVLTAPYGERVYTAGAAETSAVMSPLKLYEYLSAGKAIVCSNLPAVRAILKDGEDSLLVPAGDAAGLRSALERLERDEKLRARLGSAARKRFLERGTWRNRAARLLDELQCLRGDGAG